jgi:hypothetical protein
MRDDVEDWMIWAPWPFERTTELGVCEQEQANCASLKEKGARYELLNPRAIVMVLGGGVWRWTRTGPSSRLEGLDLWPTVLLRTGSSDLICSGAVEFHQIHLNVRVGLSLPLKSSASTPVPCTQYQHIGAHYSFLGGPQPTALCFKFFSFV